MSGVNNISFCLVMEGVGWAQRKLLKSSCREFLGVCFITVADMCETERDREGGWRILTAKSAKFVLKGSGGSLRQDS